MIKVAGETFERGFKTFAIEPGLIERIEEKPRRPGTRAPLVEEPHGTRFKGGLECLIGKLLDAHHEGGRSGGRDLFDLVTEFLGLAAQSLRQ